MGRIITESHEEAKRLLTAHRKGLYPLAEAFLWRETLNEQEILEVTGLPPVPAPTTGSLRSIGQNASQPEHLPMNSPEVFIPRRKEEFIRCRQSGMAGADEAAARASLLWCARQE